MRHRNPGAFIIAPLVYIGIITFLLFLQFAGESFFSEQIHSLNLSGTFELSQDNNTEVISSIVIDYQGLQFKFSEETPLELSYSDETYRALELVSYEKTNSGFRIGFEHNVLLNIRLDNEHEQISLNFDVPSELEPLSSLRFPFSKALGASISIPEAFQGLQVDKEGNSFIFTLPSRSVVQLEDRRIVIPGEAAERTIRYTRRAAGNEDIIDLWFENQMANITEQEYQSDIERFINVSYLGWRSSRFNAVSGTWDNKDGTSYFDEKTLMALLAEAWKRNEYSRVFLDMRTAADLHQDDLSFESSVFLGNLRNLTSDLGGQERALITRITTLVNQENTSLLTIPNLFFALRQKAEQELEDQVFDFISELTLGNLLPVESLGLMSNLYGTEIEDQRIDNLAQNYSTLIQDKIIPNISRVDEGFFFQSDPGIGDTVQTVQAALVLIENGFRQNDERFTNLGRAMVQSVLNLADPLGFVPEKLEFTAGSISATNGVVPAEQIYPLLTDNPFYPRARSLEKHFGRGTWIYSILEIQDMNSDESQFVMDIETSRNRTSYMFFRGMPEIDPLTGMQLFGIIWRNAPDFERYSKGRYYNRDTGTLMIKYFDDNPNESIIIYY